MSTLPTFPESDFKLTGSTRSSFEEAIFPIIVVPLFVYTGTKFLSKTLRNSAS